MNRRTFISGLSAIVAGTAGCLGRSAPTGSSDAATTDPTTSERQKKKKRTESDEASSLTDWERSTDCGKKHDSMHDSVVKVAEVRSSLGDGYAPIRFSDLSSGEKDILRPVTEEGGYGACDASEAFHRFVERVTDHRERQDDDRHVYLRRDGTYYRLYVEVSDQVCVY